MAHCLVLGANGFIGSHLVDALVAEGHTVRAFDRFGSDPIYEENNKVEAYVGDFLNRTDLEDALKNVDYVFHFISTTTPATAENNPSIDIETNIRMSVELMEHCTHAKVQKVIFASTGGAIYGNTAGPHKETDIALPISPYAIGKLTIEHYLRYFRVKHGVDSLVLRISNPYGERQPFHRKQGVIPIFLESACRQTPITVLGDGSMVRDYIYVKDVARMTAHLAMQKTKYDTYNIGSGVGTTVNELLETVQSISVAPLSINHQTAPSTFVQSVVLDTSRYSDEFGAPELVSMEHGMKKTYEYIAQKISKEDEHEN